MRFDFRTRRAALLAMFLAIATMGRLSAEPVTLLVGVRDDAAPFSYRPEPPNDPPDEHNIKGPLYKAGYRGYVVQICDAAFVTLADDIKVVPVHVDTATRFGDQQILWHILCDPASITPNRLRGQQPTVPVYLSGIGFATSANVPKGRFCHPIAGIADNTTAQHAGIQAIAESGETPRWRDRLLEATAVSATPATMDCEEGGKVDVVMTQKSHTDLARALCAGEIIYYIGDLEIVRKNLEAAGCDFTLSETTYRDERYTIFTRRDELDAAGLAALGRFRETVSQQVLRSDSILLDAYRTYLSPTPKSRKLAAFYWSLFGSFE